MVTDVLIRMRAMLVMTSRKGTGTIAINVLVDHEAKLVLKDGQRSALTVQSVWKKHGLPHTRRQFQEVVSIRLWKILA